jgi:hypothetical protein
MVQVVLVVFLVEVSLVFAHKSAPDAEIKHLPPSAISNLFDVIIVSHLLNAF